MAIVVGYVPTPEGAAAIDFAIEEARRRQTRMIVLNTSTGDSLVDRRYAGDSDWHALQERLNAAGVEHELSQSVSAGRDASDALIDIAQQVGADLIVIGVRRRSPVGKLIMGSQAQRILLEADCPVVAVKAAR
ncbi:MAG: universal stress protein [Tetrasphaera sp.]